MDQLVADSSTDDEPDLLTTRESDHDHSTKPIVIDDFFDKNLQIKNKKYGMNDFNKYVIKGFDIDRQLKKMFNI